MKFNELFQKKIVYKVDIFDKTDRNICTNGVSLLKGIHLYLFPNHSSQHFYFFPIDVEINYSIKINQTWDDQLLDNSTLHYVIFSGQLEQAVSHLL